MRSRSTVRSAPNFSLQRNRRFWNQLPAVSHEIRCPLPLRYPDVVVRYAFAVKKGEDVLFRSIRPGVAQPGNVLREHRCFFFGGGAIVESVLKWL